MNGGKERAQSMALEFFAFLVSERDFCVPLPCLELDYVVRYNIRCGTLWVVHITSTYLLFSKQLILTLTYMYLRT